MLDEIEQNSDGRVKFDIFTSGNLIPRAYQYEAIRNGDVDMGVTYFSDVADNFPLHEAFTFPLAYEVTNLGEDLIQTLGDRIVYAAPNETKVLCFFFQQPFYLYTSDKQVKKLEDIKGLKIAVNTSMQATVLTTLGAIPILVSQADISVAAERGVINGALATPTVVDSYGLTGVFKYALELPLGYSVGMINLNANTWTTLPVELKTIIEQAALNARYNFVEQFSNDNEKVNDILIASGGAVYNLTVSEKARWINTLNDVVDEWVATAESNGLPAIELLEAIREECQEDGITFPY